MYLLGETPADVAQWGHSRPAHKGQAGPGASEQKRNRQASPVYCSSEDDQAVKDILSVGMTHQRSGKAETGASLRAATELGPGRKHLMLGRRQRRGSLLLVAEHIHNSGILLVRERKTKRDTEGYQKTEF